MKSINIVLLLIILTGCTVPKVDNEGVDAAAHVTLGYAIGCDAKRQGLSKQEAIILTEGYAQQRESFQHGEKISKDDNEVVQWIDGARLGYEACEKVED